MTDFITHIVSEICDYAVTNGLDPDDTLAKVAATIAALLKIGTCIDWELEVRND
jgi:hypothetical protein